MKKNILLLSIMLSANAFSQTGNIGINTTTPQETLHVNGSLQITKELSLGGDAATVGNAGTMGQLLTSNGVGIAPTWSTLEDTGVVKLSALALKNNVQSVNYPADSYVTIRWETTPKLDNTNVTYNPSNGVFTIVKPGYYQILSSTHFNMSSNSLTSGTATTIIKKNNNTIGNTSSFHGERTNDVNHTIAGASYFDTGDTIYLLMSMTRNFRIDGGDSFITITYLGQ